jgi:hypothetical protein
MIAGHLNKLSPKSKKREEGIMTMDQGEALWWDDVTSPKARLLQRLEKAEMITVTSRLVHLRGFEQIGSTPDGMKKLKYQEWFITK